MKIARFTSGAIAADGGTVACRVILDDGSELDLGVDGRIPKTKKDRVVFVGAGYPTLPGARSFARGSREEKEVVEAVRAFTKANPDSEEAGMFLRAISDQ
ncbi:MAG: hypothetical protein QM760_07500 [Nibricoccus sp.]